MVSLVVHEGHSHRKAHTPNVTLVAGHRDGQQLSGMPGPRAAGIAFCEWQERRKNVYTSNEP